MLLIYDKSKNIDKKWLKLFSLVKKTIFWGIRGVQFRLADFNVYIGVILKSRRKI